MLGGGGPRPCVTSRSSSSRKGVSELRKCLLWVSLVAAVVVAPKLADAQEEKLVSNIPACQGCEIEVREIALIDMDDPELPCFTYLAGVTSDRLGRFYFSGCSGDEIVVFDSNGEFLTTVGAAGQGPGELSRLRRIFADGDQLLAIGGRENRFDIEDFSFVEAHQRPVLGGISDYLRLDDETVVQVIDYPSPDRAGKPLFVIKDGTVSANFGDTTGIYMMDANNLNRRTLASATKTGEFWVAHLGRYVLELWSADGSLKRTLSRDLDWFPPQTMAKRDYRNSDDLASLLDVKFVQKSSEGGYLWTMIYPGRSNYIEADGVLVEVMTDTGTLLVSDTVNAYLLGWLGDRHAWGMAGATASGSPYIALYEVNLTGQ